MVLGLVEGAELTFLRRSLGGDPLEIRIYGAAISLRDEQARRFHVSAEWPRRLKPRFRSSGLPCSRNAAGTVAVVGNPNAGKSSVFNRLTGLRQHTANYPGVTVERRIGRGTFGGVSLDLIDLPGTYSLSPTSADEQIAVDVLFGRVAGTPRPDAILAVIDSTRLYQGLYLLQQLIELGRPMIVALTMIDAAEREGRKIDFAGVARGARRRAGVSRRRDLGPRVRGAQRSARASSHVAAAARRGALAGAAPRGGHARRAVARGRRRAASRRSRAAADRCERGPRALVPQAAPTSRPRARTCLAREPPLAAEARRRYAWVRATLARVESPGSGVVTQAARLVDWINRPWPSTVLFIALMVVVFQAVFAWATPLVDLIDAGVSGHRLAASPRCLPDGMLESFVVDGVIAGVGSVIVFLPQILILFLFIILMEDTGYLARAAFLVDRAMRTVGLSGQSVIPLLSSFACAVPSIMATRVIPNRRDRIATILAAPFMTCSARLPVYALLIGAFVPVRSVGIFNLQGLVLFGLYAIGIVGGVGDGAAAAQLGAARRESDVHPGAAGVPRAERADRRDEAARSRPRVPAAAPAR